MASTRSSASMDSSVNDPQREKPGGISLLSSQPWLTQVKKSSPGLTVSLMLAVSMPQLPRRALLLSALSSAWAWVPATAARATAAAAYLSRFIKTSFQLSVPDGCGRAAHGRPATLNGQLRPGVVQGNCVFNCAQSIGGQQVLVVGVALDPGGHIGAAVAHPVAVAFGPVQGMAGQVAGNAASANGLGHPDVVHAGNIAFKGVLKHAPVAFDLNFKATGVFIVGDFFAVAVCHGSVSFRAVQKAGSEGAGYGFQSLDDTARVVGFSVHDDVADFRRGLQVLGGNIDAGAGKHSVDGVHDARLVAVDMQNAARGGVVGQGDFGKIDGAHG